MYENLGDWKTIQNAWKYNIPKAVGIIKMVK